MWQSRNSEDFILSRSVDPGRRILSADRVKEKHSSGFMFVCSIIFCISVATTIYFSESMSGGMNMSGGWKMSMMWMRMPGQTWFASAAMFLLMWFVMMIAMMLPSAFPMFFIYHKAEHDQPAIRAGKSTWILATGYFFIWTVIGLAVYIVGVWFAAMTMQSSTLSRATPILSGVALILSGVIQFTDWKMRGLSRCRNLKSCADEPGFGKHRSPWYNGLREGICCAIVSSGPMFILLILGAMNLIVMTIVAIWIAMEKLLPKPRFIVRVWGFAAIGAGLFMIVRFVF